MGVGTTHAEGADPGHSGLAQWLQLGDHAQAQRVEVDGRVGLGEVQRRRHLARVHGQQRLEQPRRTGRALEVPDVRLDRTDGQRFPAPGEHLTQPCGLDRVTGPGPRAVQLDEVHLGRCEARARVRSADHGGLRPRSGHGQRFSTAIVVERPARQDRVDTIAVRGRLVEPSQHQDDAALTAHVPVRAGVEDVRPAGRGQRAELGGDRAAQRGQVQVDAAGEHRVRLTAVQSRAGLVHGDERTRLRGVDGEARSRQAQHMGYPVGDHAPGQSGERVHARVRARQGGVVVGHRAEHDPGPAACRRLRRRARVLQGLPRQLQHQPLLRVHRRRLARRDPEEVGVEGVHVGQVSATANTGGVAPGQGGGIRPPACGHLPHGVDALAQ